jgi:hypothetical protein
LPVLVVLLVLFLLFCFACIVPFRIAFLHFCIFVCLRFWTYMLMDLFTCILLNSWQDCLESVFF